LFLILLVGYVYRQLRKALLFNRLQLVDSVTLKIF